MSVQSWSIGKRILLFVALMTVLLGAAAPVAYWLYQQQRVMDDGATIVVFNNSAARVQLATEDATTTLSPSTTWRSEALDSGAHSLSIDGRKIVVETGLDRAGHLVAVEPVALALVDRSGEYIDLSTGRMMGAEGIRLVSSHPAAPVIRVPRHSTLSPYETLPESALGAPPLEALIISADLVGDEPRLREFIASSYAE